MSIALKNSVLSLTVNPAYGGKITSLRDLRSGREWLWTNPHLHAEEKISYGCSYLEELDTGGWDEIFPSVSPCEVGIFKIPDHGDLVSLRWEILDSGPQHLEMAVSTRFAPCRFTRRLELQGEILQVSYRLENLGPEAIPWLWCVHPLIAIEPGMRILLPTGIAMRTTGGLGIDPGIQIKWPHAPGLPALDLIPEVSSGYAVKLFTTTDDIDQVSIIAKDGQLQLSWDRNEIPSLGLWLNYGAWSGSGSPPYFNLGLEPSTAPFDSLAEAVMEKAAHILAPGEVRTWSLRCLVRQQDLPTPRGNCSALHHGSSA